MALAFTTPDGPAGARVDVLTPTGRQTAVMVTLPEGPIAADGQQVAWAIDPLTGNDSNAGTPAAPLRTMAAFDARMADLLVTVPQTLQLVGNVLDAPLWLSGTRYAVNGSLAVSGTRTAIGTATVTVVTPLGGATPLIPWQLTTTGIDWTTVALGSQLRFSTGQLTFIVQVIDPNNVVCGALAAPGFATAPVTPTVASTIAVASLSRALPPVLGQQGATPPFVYQVSMTDVSFDPTVFGGGVAQYWFGPGSHVELYGCELRTGSGAGVVASGDLSLRGCLVSITGSGQTFFRFGTENNIGSYGLVVQGGGAAFFGAQTGRYDFSALVMTGTRFVINGAATRVSLSRGTHIRNTAGPVLVNDGGILLTTGIVNGSAAAFPGGNNTGIGIDVPLGQFAYQGAANKPTVTGASDTRVGGVARTYAQIPFIAAQLDAIPPTVTTLVGNGSSIVQQ